MGGAAFHYLLQVNGRIQLEPGQQVDNSFTCSGKKAHAGVQPAGPSGGRQTHFRRMACKTCSCVSGSSLSPTKTNLSSLENMHIDISVCVFVREREKDM